MYVVVDLVNPLGAVAAGGTCTCTCSCTCNCSTTDSQVGSAGRQAGYGAGDAGHDNIVKPTST